MADFPGSDFESVKLPLNMGDRELFPNGNFEIFKHKSEEKSLAKVYFEKKFHGPPVHVHGGAQAYILDEIMGCTGWMHGYSVVAKNIKVHFHKPTPVETQLYGRGEIIDLKDPFLYITAEIYTLDGKVYSQSAGEFRILNSEELSRLAP